MRKLFCILAMLSFASLAQAGNISVTGALPSDDPNAAQLIQIRLLHAGDLHFQTYGYGGGTNVAGQLIAPGGFDPYLSLFLGTGNAATFLASNDDGVCPPGTPAPACADSTLDLPGLAAGDYTLALTLPFNFSLAENHGGGTLGDGFIGLDASFSDGACGSTCSSAFSVDILSGVDAVLIPAPGTLPLVLSCLPMLWRRRFNHEGVST